MHRQARTKSVRIVDSRGFAEVLRRAIETNFGGNQSAAAGATGISQPELSRLLNGKIRSLRPYTLARLEARLSSANREALRSALLSPMALNTVLPRYERWLAGAGPSLLLNSGTSLRALAEPKWLKERHELFRYVRRQFPEVVTEFHDWLRKQRHIEDSGRLNMAWHRILEPLLQWSDSGGVERDWQELSEAELRQFVAHGIRREKILLRRPSKLKRAQDLEPDDNWIAEHSAVDSGKPRRRTAQIVNEIQLLRARLRSAKRRGG